MEKEKWLKILAGLIASMFFYAAFSKLWDYEQSQIDMRNQLFPNAVADVLTWLVPVIEFIIVVLLVIRPTRLVGFGASLGLLTMFTIYIVIALSMIFGRTPCACGGILNNLPYEWHFAFNLLFMFLAYRGIGLEKGWTLKETWTQIKNTWFGLRKRRLKKEYMKNLAQG
ncbi:MauE/DoxX family redox-associated membrane protein [Olivibacter sp. XZL3]|uniref:MauE/DoxX family redox-associated membrane protein n=1 Tax=Olivibacter sp. XZL3 TaxID=1735116 RepID=UPI001066DD2E|nr:MauE/DoxX family redox-associated membrane protein [Olivibacter sp. XZL3]